MNTVKINENEQMTETQPAYSEVNAQLFSFDVGMSAADVHGLLVGLLSVKPDVTLTDWLQHIFSTDERVEAVKKNEALYAALQTLFSVTWRQLNETAFDLNLFLPDASVQSLSERTTALTCWCQSLLVGFSRSGMALHSAVKGETGEVIRDLLEISQMECEVEDSEESEQAYHDVQEYLRVAALTVHSQYVGQAHASSLGKKELQ